MTMEVHAFVEGMLEYRKQNNMPEITDEAVRAYCEAVKERHEIGACVPDVVKTERSRLADIRDWESSELNAFDLATARCDKLWKEYATSDMHAEVALGIYGKELSVRRIA